MQSDSPAYARAYQLFFYTKGNDIPEGAKNFVRILAKKVGLCSEVYITAFCHYAQMVEHLECTEEMYALTDEFRKMYAQ